MNIRKMKPEEYLQVEALQALAFLFPFDKEAAEKQMMERPERVTAGNIWVCTDNEDKIVSTVVNTPYDIHYDGHIVGMGGIGGVASAPEARMRGGIRGIFEKIFEEDLQKGRLFSVLYPFSHRYYRQFGYDLCHAERIVKFPTMSLKKFRNQGTVALYIPGSDDGDFRAVHAQYAARYNYAIQRGDRDWKNLLSSDPYKDRKYCYSIRRGEKPVAYCMFTPERAADMTLTMIVSDWAYVGREGLTDLFGFLYKLAAQFTYIKMDLPDDFALSALLDEAYDVRVEGLVRSMARVLDVGKALELMRHPEGNGAYSIAVQDDFLPFNTATYHVAFENGNVMVNKGESMPDLSVSVQTLTQLCLGYLSLDMALLKEDVQCSGNLETLRDVFVRKPMLLTDRF